METLRHLKDKQKSVKTINKITKAMQLVSSAKSQKAVKDLNDYQSYFNRVKSIIHEIDKDIVKKDETFNGTYWILVMSDLGLAGGYNSNLVKEVRKVRKPNDKFLILGNKGVSYAKRHKDTAEWFSLNDILKEGNQLMELTTRIKKEYFDNKLKVNIIYTEYKSQVEFLPLSKTILPIDTSDFNLDENSKDDLTVTEFEPNREELLKELKSIYINSFLVNVFKEASASEHTVRKNAMETATSNGKDLLDRLNIKYNRARQAKITQEISEIIGGAESLK